MKEIDLENDNVHSIAIKAVARIQALEHALKEAVELASDLHADVHDSNCQDWNNANCEVCKKIWSLQESARRVLP